MLPRQRIERRRQQESEDGHHQDNQRQVGEVVQPRIEGREPVARQSEAQHQVCEPEAQERNADLHQDPRPHVAPHVMPQLMRQHRLDFVVGVALEERVGENDAAGPADSHEGGVRLLRFLRELPLIDPAHPRAGPFAQSRESLAQSIIVERLELIEERKQHDWRELDDEQEQAHKHRPRNHPPALRSDADDAVDDFYQNRAENKSDQPALELVPQPGAHLLVRQFVLVLQPKPKVVEGSAQHLHDQREHQHVKEHCQEVVLSCPVIRPVAKRSGPARHQQHDQ